MKRYIRSASRMSILRSIRDDLVTEGKRAEINTEQHNCVDVFDNDGNIIEQHYAVQTDEHPSRKRYKYVKADPPGTGDYNRVEYDAKLNDYTGVDHLIKYVNRTNKDKTER